MPRCLGFVNYTIPGIEGVQVELGTTDAIF